MENQITLSLAHGPDNPRNSEGAFVTLNDGRIMFAYSRYYGESWSDHATADIAARFSKDNGRSWSEKDVIIVKNEGKCNVMSVSLLRLNDGRIALFYCRKDSKVDLHMYLRYSSDEGATWSEPIRCIPAPGYFVVNNDRIVQLKSGRIIIPAALHRAKFGEEFDGGGMDGRGIAIFFFSDDDGQSWQESEDWWALPERSTSGLQEPGLIQLRDSLLYAWCRTSKDYQWEMKSEDDGNTWTAPQPSNFRAPCSPLSMKRIPQTGDLVAVWNDLGFSMERDKASWSRTPLTIAFSADEGKVWRNKQNLEDKSDHGYCYTAIHFTDDSGILLAYCSGGGENTGVLQDTCIRRLDLEWLYR